MQTAFFSFSFTTECLDVYMPRHVTLIYPYQISTNTKTISVLWALFSIYDICTSLLFSKVPSCNEHIDIISFSSLFSFPPPLLFDKEITYLLPISIPSLLGKNIPVGYLPESKG